MDAVDRIFALVDSKFKEQKDFAAAIGVTPQKVSAWRKRDLSSYSKHLPKIAEVLGTTMEYLLTGKEPGQKELAEKPVFISREAQAVAVAYDQADEKSKSIVRLTLNVDAAGPTESASEPTEEAM